MISSLIQDTRNVDKILIVLTLSCFCVDYMTHFSTINIVMYSFNKLNVISKLDAIRFAYQRKKTFLNVTDQFPKA